MVVMLACHFSLSGRSASLFVAGQCWCVAFRDSGKIFIHLIRRTSLFQSAKVSPEFHTHTLQDMLQYADSDVFAQWPFILA